MASASISRLLNPILRSSRTISPILRPYPRLPRTLQPAAARRFAHTIPKPPPIASSAPSSPPTSSEAKPRKLLEPHYELTFTCVPCGGRSSHTISKQGYHKGSVLITCPSCRNRHVISDHLNIFGDRKITVEDLMREKGQLVKRGTLGEDGDVEFWEDGTVTERGSGSDSKEVKSGLDALSEEEEATRSREAREPSSQSAQPANATSTPLSNTGNRPSLDSARHTNPLPSTRRQYSTNNDYRFASINDEVSRFKYPPPRPINFLNRVPKKEMIKHVKKQIATRHGIEANLSPQAKRALEYERRSRSINDDLPLGAGGARYQTARYNNEIVLPASIPVPKGKKPSKIHLSGGDETESRSTDREKNATTKSPSPRMVLSEPIYRGVRFYGTDTVDGRPRYIRAGPGPLRKQRRPPQRQGKTRSRPDRGADLNARINLTVTGQDLVGRTLTKQPSQALQAAIEQAAAKRSRGSNEFIRPPS